MTIKTCTVCKEIKSLEAFDKSGNEGLSCRCKSCQSLKNKRYRHENTDKVKEIQKAWYESNRDRITCDKKTIRKIDPRKNMLSTAKHRAKKKGVPFSIEIDDIFIPKLCPILNIELVAASGLSNDSSPSLDRIVPDLGYVPGNVQVISKLANSMKTNASISNLKLFAKWIAETFKD